MVDRRLLTHPAPRGFAETRVWVFDLDNTLYPAECNLFAQVDKRMGEYISGLLGVTLPEAKQVQKRYYIEHGTTLAGLMKVNGIEPSHFLDYVHDIDYSPVPDSPGLGRAIAGLPGRRLIFTNGSRRHAQCVVERLGVSRLFEDIFDIVDADYVPKPREACYHSFLAAHAVEPAAAAMFEDLPHNLEAPHGLGMTTVLVHASQSDHPIYRDIKGWSRLPDHVHHMTEDLTGFLGTLG